METGWVEIYYKELSVDSQMKTFYKSIKKQKAFVSRHTHVTLACHCRTFALKAKQYWDH